MQLRPPPIVQPAADSRRLGALGPEVRGGARTAERFDLVQRVAEIGVFERDLSKGRVWWSPQMFELLGLPEDEELPRTLDDALRRVFAEDTPKMRSALAAAEREGKSGTIQFRYWRGEELRYGEIRYEPMAAGDTIVGYRGTIQDRTEGHDEAVAAEHELGIRARLLDAVDAAVLATDATGLVTNWNSAAEKMYGWSAEEAVGQPLLSLAVGDDAKTATLITNSFIADGHWEGEYEVPHRDGSHIDAFIRLSAVRNAEGDPVGIVGVSVDIGSRVAMEDDLRGARDYLQAVTASMAEGLITLDAQGHLAYMNDAADRLLGWREAGLLGEPIVPLGFAGSDLEQGDEAARVDSELIVGRNHAEIEISYTAAPFESQRGEQGTVIVFADVTEQRAVERIAREKLEGLSWIGKIRDALDSGRLAPYAQPIVCLASGEVAYHELLVRMLDDEGRPLAPDRFLPIAEEFGLIAEIDELMIRRAVEQTAHGHHVNVNLSAQSVSKPGMSELIGSEIKRLRTDPALLTIELTETALIKSERAARRFVERLSELGCGFALDDFGTGYGGFMYLKQLPIDYLKIDMEFVGDLTVNEGSQRVVRAVVDLATGFGQKTIAEGIEDEATRVALAEMGVDYGQGFLFGHPVPVEEALSTNRQEADDA